MAGVRVGIRPELDAQGMRSVEMQFNKMMSRLSGRQANFSLNSKSFTQPLGRITASANEFTKSLEASNARVIAFGASVGIINAVSNAFKGLVAETIKFQKVMMDINVIMGSSQQAIESFGFSLFDIAKNTAQSFNQVAEAALEFSRQGLSMEETLRRTNDALILTRLTSLDAEEAVSGLTAAVNAFGDTGVTTTDIIDKLAAVDVNFAVSSADLINALERTGAVAIDAGVQLDNLIGIVTSLQQTTARGGSVIGNGLKTIFTRIRRPDSIRQLEEMGVQVKSLQGNLLPADKILQNIAGSFDRLTESQQSNVTQFAAGIFQANIFKSALRDLAKEQNIFEKATAIAGDAMGDAAIKNEKLNTTLDALAKRTTVSIEELAEVIGDLTLKGPIGGVLENIEAAANGIKSSLGGGEEVGNTFFKGFVKGIGNVLAGPGLIAFTAVMGKMLLNVGKFASQSLKDVLGIVGRKEKIAGMENAIVDALARNKQIQEGLNALEGDRLAQEKYMLKVLEAQTNAMIKQKQLAAGLSGALLKAGVNPDLTVSSTNFVDLDKSGTAEVFSSSGLMPSRSSARKERQGAVKAGYTPGAVAGMTLPGVGKVVYNKAEKVKQFPGMKQPAIMPPESSRAGKAYERNFQKTHGFNPYAFNGYVPNFASISNDLTQGSQSMALRGIEGGHFHTSEQQKTVQKFYQENPNFKLPLEDGSAQDIHITFKTNTSALKGRTFKEKSGSQLSLGSYLDALGIDQIETTIPFSYIQDIPTNPKKTAYNKKVQKNLASANNNEKGNVGESLFLSSREGEGYVSTGGVTATDEFGGFTVDKTKGKDNFVVDAISPGQIPFEIKAGKIDINDIAAKSIRRYSNFAFRDQVRDLANGFIGDNSPNPSIKGMTNGDVAKEVLFVTDQIEEDFLVESLAQLARMGNWSPEGMSTGELQSLLQKSQLQTYLRDNPELISQGDKDFVISHGISSGFVPNFIGYNMPKEAYSLIDQFNDVIDINKTITKDKDAQIFQKKKMFDVLNSLQDLGIDKLHFGGGGYISPTPGAGLMEFPIQNIKQLINQTGVKTNFMHDGYVPNFAKPFEIFNADGKTIDASNEYEMPDGGFFMPSKGQMPASDYDEIFGEYIDKAGNVKTRSFKLSELKSDDVRKTSSFPRTRKKSGLNFQDQVGDRAYYGDSGSPTGRFDWESKTAGDIDIGLGQYDPQVLINQDTINNASIGEAARSAQSHTASHILEKAWNTSSVQPNVDYSYMPGSEEMEIFMPENLVEFTKSGFDGFQQVGNKINYQNFGSNISPEVQGFVNKFKGQRTDPKWLSVFMNRDQVSPYSKGFVPNFIDKSKSIDTAGQTLNKLSAISLKEGSYSRSEIQKAIQAVYEQRTMQSFSGESMHQQAENLAERYIAAIKDAQVDDPTGFVSSFAPGKGTINNEPITFNEISLALQKQGAFYTPKPGETVQEDLMAKGMIPLPSIDQSYRQKLLDMAGLKDYELRPDEAEFLNLISDKSKPHLNDLRKEFDLGNVKIDDVIGGGSVFAIKSPDGKMFKVPKDNLKKEKDPLNMSESFADQTVMGAEILRDMDEFSDKALGVKGFATKKFGLDGIEQDFIPGKTLTEIIGSKPGVQAQSELIVDQLQKKFKASANKKKNFSAVNEREKRKQSDLESFRQWGGDFHSDNIIVSPSAEEEVLYLLQSGANLSEFPAEAFNIIDYNKGFIPNFSESLPYIKQTKSGKQYVLRRDLQDAQNKYKDAFFKQWDKNPNMFFVAGKRITETPKEEPVEEFSSGKLKFKDSRDLQDFASFAMEEGYPEIMAAMVSKTTTEEESRKKLDFGVPTLRQRAYDRRAGKKIVENKPDSLSTEEITSVGIDDFRSFPLGQVGADLNRAYNPGIDSVAPMEYLPSKYKTSVDPTKFVTSEYDEPREILNFIKKQRGSSSITEKDISNLYHSYKAQQKPVVTWGDLELNTGFIPNFFNIRDDKKERSKLLSQWQDKLNQAKSLAASGRPRVEIDPMISKLNAEANKIWDQIQGLGKAEGFVPNFENITLYRGQPNKTKDGEIYTPELSQPSINEILFDPLLNAKTPQDVSRIARSFASAHSAGTLSGRSGGGTTGSIGDIFEEYLTTSMMDSSGKFSTWEDSQDPYSEEWIDPSKRTGVDHPMNSIASGAVSFSTKKLKSDHFAVTKLPTGKDGEMKKNVGKIHEKTIPKKNVFGKNKIEKLLSRGAEPPRYPMIDKMKNSIIDGSFFDYWKKAGGLYLNIDGTRNDRSLIQLEKDLGTRRGKIYESRFDSVAPHMGRKPGEFYNEHEIAQIVSKGFVPNFANLSRLEKTKKSLRSDTKNYLQVTPEEYKEFEQMIDWMRGEFPVSGIKLDKSTLSISADTEDIRHIKSVMDNPSVIRNMEKDGIPEPNKLLKSFLKKHTISVLESKNFQRDGISEGVTRNVLLRDYFKGDEEKSYDVAYRGLIPNFSNPLTEAIKREKKAGVPASRIRVERSSQLSSRANPLGLAVTNTIDEPMGINQGIRRAKSMRIDPKMHGAHKGLVPNFAAAPIGGGPPVPQYPMGTPKPTQSPAAPKPVSPEVAQAASDIVSSLNEFDDALQFLKGKLKDAEYDKVSKAVEEFKSALLKAKTDMINRGDMTSMTSPDVKGMATIARDELLGAFEKAEIRSSGSGSQQNDIIEAGDKVSRVFNDIADKTGKAQKIIDEETKSRDNGLQKLFFFQSMISMANGFLSEFAQTTQGTTKNMAELAMGASSVFAAYMQQKELIPEITEALGARPEEAMTMGSLFGEGADARRASTRRGEREAAARNLERQSKGGLTGAMARFTGNTGIGKTLGLLGRSFTRFLPIVGQLYTGFTLVNEAFKFFAGESIFEYFSSSADKARKQIEELGKVSETVSGALEAMSSKADIQQKMVDLEVLGGQRTQKQEQDYYDLKIKSLDADAKVMAAMGDLYNENKVGEAGLIAVNKALGGSTEAHADNKKALQDLLVVTKMLTAAQSNRVSFSENVDKADSDDNVKRFMALSESEGTRTAFAIKDLLKGSSEGSQEDQARALQQNIAEIGKLISNPEMDIDSLNFDANELVGSEGIKDILKGLKGSIDEFEYDMGGLGDNEVKAFKKLMESLTRGLGKNKLTDSMKEVMMADTKFAKELNKLIDLSKTRIAYEKINLNNTLALAEIRREEVDASESLLSEYGLMSTSVAAFNKAQRDARKATEDSMKKRADADNELSSALLDQAKTIFTTNALNPDLKRDGEELSKAIQDFNSRMIDAAEMDFDFGEFNSRLESNINIDDEVRNGVQKIFSGIEVTEGTQFQEALNEIANKIAKEQDPRVQLAATLASIESGILAVEEETLEKMTQASEKHSQTLLALDLENDRQEQKNKIALQKLLIDSKSVEGAKLLNQELSKAVVTQEMINENLRGEAATLSVQNKFALQKLKLEEKSIGYRSLILENLKKEAMESASSGMRDITKTSISNDLLSSGPSENKNLRETQQLLLKNQLIKLGSEKQSVETAAIEAELRRSFLSDLSVLNKIVKDETSAEADNLAIEVQKKNLKLKQLESNKKSEEIVKSNVQQEILDLMTAQKTSEIRRALMEKAGYRNLIADLQNKKELDDLKEANKLEKTKLQRLILSGKINELVSEQVEQELLSMEKSSLINAKKELLLSMNGKLAERMRTAVELEETGNKLKALRNAREKALMDQSNLELSVGAQVQTERYQKLGDVRESATRAALTDDPKDILVFAEAYRAYNKEVENNSQIIDSLRVKMAEMAVSADNLRSDLVDSGIESARSGLKQAFKDMASGAKTAKEAFTDVGLGIASTILDRLMEHNVDKIISDLTYAFTGVKADKDEAQKVVDSNAELISKMGEKSQVEKDLTSKLQELVGKVEKGLTKGVKLEDTDKLASQMRGELEAGAKTWSDNFGKQINSMYGGKPEWLSAIEGLKEPIQKSSQSTEKLSDAVSTSDSLLQTNNNNLFKLKESMDDLIKSMEKAKDPPQSKDPASKVITDTKQKVEVQKATKAVEAVKKEDPFKQSYNKNPYVNQAMQRRSMEERGLDISKYDDKKISEITRYKNIDISKSKLHNLRSDKEHAQKMKSIAQEKVLSFEGARYENKGMFLGGNQLVQREGENFKEFNKLKKDEAYAQANFDAQQNRVNNLKLNSDLSDDKQLAKYDAAVARLQLFADELGKAQEALRPLSDELAKAKEEVSRYSLKAKEAEAKEKVAQKEVNDFITSDRAVPAGYERPQAITPPTQSLANPQTTPVLAAASEANVDSSVAQNISQLSSSASTASGAMSQLGPAITSVASAAQNAAAKLNAIKTPSAPPTPSLTTPKAPMSSFGMPTSGNSKTPVAMPAPAAQPPVASGAFAGGKETGDPNKKWAGGKIQKFNKGGFVKGPGGVDNVPAMLTAGEYVVPKEDVNRFEKGGGVSAVMDRVYAGTSAVVNTAAMAYGSHAASRSAFKGTEDTGPTFDKKAFKSIDTGFDVNLNVDDPRVSGRLAAQQESVSAYGDYLLAKHDFEVGKKNQKFEKNMGRFQQIAGMVGGYVTSGITAGATNLLARGRDALGGMFKGKEEKMLGTAQKDAAAYTKKMNEQDPSGAWRKNVVETNPGGGLQQQGGINLQNAAMINPAMRSSIQGGIAGGINVNNAAMINPGLKATTRNYKQPNTQPKKSKNHKFNGGVIQHLAKGGRSQMPDIYDLPEYMQWMRKVPLLTNFMPDREAINNPGKGYNSMFGDVGSLVKRMMGLGQAKSYTNHLGEKVTQKGIFPLSTQYEDAGYKSAYEGYREEQLGLGKKDPGKYQKFSKGPIRDFLGFNNGGTVPSMLTAGESFIPANVAKKIGYSTLEKLNTTGEIPIVQGKAGIDKVGPVGLSDGDFIIKKSSTDKLMRKNPNTFKMAVKNPDGFRRQVNNYYDGGMVSSGRSPVSSPSPSYSPPQPSVDQFATPQAPAAQAAQSAGGSSSVTNNVNVNVTIDQSGKETSTKTGDTGKGNSDKDLSMKIKAAVIDVIRQEKRVGGELS